MSTQNIVRTTKVHKYICPNCESHWEGEPTVGWVFPTASMTNDEDGTVFSTDTKVLVGEKIMTCGKLEELYDYEICRIPLDADIVWVKCDGWECEGCGMTCFSDNDNCGAHEYGRGGDSNAKAFVAANCKCETKPAQPTADGPSKNADQTASDGAEAPVAAHPPVAAVGDRVKVTANRAEGTPWDVGTVIIIDEVTLNSSWPGGALYRAHTEGDSQTWQLYAGSTEPYDEYLDEKFRPKEGPKKKVTVLDF